MATTRTTLGRPVVRRPIARRAKQSFCLRMRTALRQAVAFCAAGVAGDESAAESSWMYRHAREMGTMDRGMYHFR